MLPTGHCHGLGHVNYSAPRQAFEVFQKITITVAHDLKENCSLPAPLTLAHKLWGNLAKLVELSATLAAIMSQCKGFAIISKHDF
jgi:hypothetical protein